MTVTMTLGRPLTRIAKLRREFDRNPMLALGSALVLLSLLLMVAGPWIAPFDPQAVVAKPSLPPPAFGDLPGLLWRSLTGQATVRTHWFGTDASGLDIFSRVIAAPRTDIAIALSANILSFGFGTFLGLIAGFYRGRLVNLLMRVSDLVQSFPIFITGMILVALAGRTAPNIVIALGFLYVPIYLRLTRTEVMSQRSRGYVDAARALGNREIVIALRHVLPNSLAPGLIQASVTIGFAILMTAGLSFIGAGVRPPTPEWGLMISAGTSQLVQNEWWPSLFPGIAISITVFGYAAFGNGLERYYAR